MHPLVRLGSTTFCLFWPLYLGRDSYFGNHCCGTIFRRVALSCTYSVCVLFVSLLSLCPLCFYLLQHPFSVHAQLRHAVTHHSACFLQQPFTAFLFFFSPAAISSCIPQTTMCSSATFLTLLSLLSFDSAFCSTTQHLAYGLALVSVCIPATISFSSCLFAVNCSARHF